MPLNVDTERVCNQRQLSCRDAKTQRISSVYKFTGAAEKTESITPLSLLKTYHAFEVGPQSEVTRTDFTRRDRDANFTNYHPFNPENPVTQSKNFEDQPVSSVATCTSGFRHRIKSTGEHCSG